MKVGFLTSGLLIPNSSPIPLPLMFHTVSNLWIPDEIKLSTPTPSIEHSLSVHGTKSLAGQVHAQAGGKTDISSPTSPWGTCKGKCYLLFKHSFFFFFPVIVSKILKPFAFYLQHKETLAFPNYLGNTHRLKRHSRRGGDSRWEE